MATYVTCSLTAKDTVAIEAGGSSCVYIEGDFDIDEMKDYVLGHYELPESIFEESDLVEWAEENGYVKEE